jgi:tubulin--tyrosine ligase
MAEVCTRAAGCPCADCVASAAAMADISGGGSKTSSVECTRSAGCKCAMCDISMTALGDMTNQSGSALGGRAGSVCAAGAGESAAAAALYTFAAVDYNGGRTVGETYDVERDGKLGSVYTMLTEVLAGRGDWARVKAIRHKIEGEAGNKKSEELQLPRSFQLLLGTAQGKGIKFGQLGYGMWPPPLVNYYRGFNCLCRKVQLIELLREAAKNEHTANILEAMPETFLFYPSRPDEAELNEHEPLAAAHARRVEVDTDTNLWILKPSDGAKGERIELMLDLEAMQTFLRRQADSEETAKSGWVVQRYIDRPLLLRGQRKFDVRCWVLLDANYDGWLYREGVLRTGAVPYTVTADNLGDKFVHLTNHCIAAQHEDYGKFEATNEMFYPEFSAYLEESFPGRAADAVALSRNNWWAATPAASSQRAAAAEPSPAGEPTLLDSVILPQFRAIAAQTLAAARDRLQVSTDYYRSFHLFGYDFLIDADFRVWLCEINASPAVAEQLMPKLVRDLIGRTVDAEVSSLPAFGDAAAAAEGQHAAPAAAEVVAAMVGHKAAWEADLAEHHTELVPPGENGFEQLDLPP